MNKDFNHPSSSYEFMKKTEQEKYYSLQILRAVAAWLVVYHHLIYFYGGSKSESVVSIFFLKYGNFGVDIFFVLSGFVMYFTAKKTNQTAGIFLINRLFRVAPIYYFYTSIIIICIYLFPEEFSYTAFDFESLVSSLFFIPIANPSGLGEYPLLTVGWTLNFEMFFYAMLGISLLISKRLAIPLCFIFILILPMIYPKGIVYARVASSHLLYEFLVGFVIAYMFTETRVSQLLRKYRAHLIMLVVFAILVSLLMFHSHGFYKLFLAGNIVFIALLIEPWIDIHSRIIKKLVVLGDESFSTYLVHIIIIGIFVHFTGKNLSDTGFWLTFAAISVTVSLASTLSYRHIERGSAIASIRKKLLTWTYRSA